MTDRALRVLGIAGSLREGSLNRALLRAAAARAPDSLRIEAFPLDEVPMFHTVGEGEAYPAPVRSLRTAVETADGVLIVTPEYNYGIPGVLKNAIDWASRPAYASPFRDKPVAIMGAAPGTVGTARAQGALRNVLFGMGCAVFPWPEFLLSRAKEAFDEDGRLTRERSGELLVQMLTQLEAWCRALRSFGENASR